MPIAFTVEGVRKQICELLVLSTHPVKAKQISAVLGPNSPELRNKRYVNSILYEFKKYGIVLRDQEFRWSVSPSAIKLDSEASQFVPTADPQEKKRVRELGPRPVSARIGHWVFTLGREPESGREVWRVECAMCGFQTGCRVQNHQQVYPLTGRLSFRRRQHDKAVHAKRAKEQLRIERALLEENGKLQPTTPVMSTL